MTNLLGVFGALLSSLAMGLAAHALSCIPVARSPELGQRGVQRKRLLESGGLLARLEPGLRVLAGWVALLPIERARNDFERRIVHAGQHLGLTADEALAVTCVGGVAGLSLGYAWVQASGVSFVWLLMTSSLGAMWLSLHLDLEARRRRKEINRQLPSTIDLLSLCVGAGSDFPAAVRFVLAEGEAHAALTQELTQVLQELELGHTRRAALQALAERVPTDAVRDFVNAVSQAEEKGTPLAEVLEIQAGMLRMRRSVAAEEAAAQASVKMLLPLILLMACIMLILFGALIIKAMDGGL